MYFVAILLDFSRFEIELSGLQPPFFRYLNTPILVVFSVFAKRSEVVNGNAVDFRSGRMGLHLFSGREKNKVRRRRVRAVCICGICVSMRFGFRFSFFPAFRIAGFLLDSEGGLLYSCFRKSGLSR